MVYQKESLNSPQFIAQKLKDYSKGNNMYQED